MFDTGGCYDLNITHASIEESIEDFPAKRAGLTSTSVCDGQKKGGRETQPDIRLLVWCWMSRLFAWILRLCKSTKRRRSEKQTGPTQRKDAQNERRTKQADTAGFGSSTTLQAPSADSPRVWKKRVDGFGTIVPSEVPLLTMPYVGREKFWESGETQCAEKASGNTDSPTHYCLHIVRMGRGKPQRGLYKISRASATRESEPPTLSPVLHPDRNLAGFASQLSPKDAKKIRLQSPRPAVSPSTPKRNAGTPSRHQALQLIGSLVGVEPPQLSTATAATSTPPLAGSPTAAATQDRKSPGQSQQCSTRMKPPTKTTSPPFLPLQSLAPRGGKNGDNALNPINKIIVHG